MACIAQEYLESRICKLEEYIDQLEEQNKDAGGELELWQRENAELKAQIKKYEEYTNFIKSCLKKENLKCMDINAYFAIKEYIEGLVL